MPGNTQNPLKTYKITADIASCCGYGLCATLCPEIYKLDDNGIVYLAADKVSGELVEAAIEGAESCPAQVLAVTLLE
jgi:ferredoxin